MSQQNKHTAGRLTTGLLAFFKTTTTMSTATTQKDQIWNLKVQLSEVEQELTDLATYLSSSKFAGPGNNFVNAQEVLTRIIEIRMKATIDTPATAGV